MRQIARRAGVPFRCRDLTHHFTSLFAQRAGDLSALQAILGHKIAIAAAVIRAARVACRWSALQSE